MKTLSLFRGAAALSTILLVGAIVIETALAALIASYLVSQQGLGLKRSQEASFAARSGLQEGLIRLVRDKDFSPSPNPYTLLVSSTTVSILVCKELEVDFSPEECSASTIPGKYQVGATAQVVNKKSRIKATLLVSSSTGLVQVESIEEVAAQ